ncbi:MAG: hypothetical protein V4534_07390 [Myxococcota bacterium]
MRHILIASFIFCGTLSSTEIDSFTLRDKTLKDGTAEMNAMMQRYLDSAVAKMNRAGSCDAKKFEDTLHGLTGGLAWSKVEGEIEHSTILDKRTLPRCESVYQDICLVDGVALYLARLGFLMRFGNLYIGSDKFGHFIDQGFDYYRSFSLEDGMRFGEMTERTYYGLMTTAVYSYGDLSANLDGYQFWSSLAKGDDPYFTCQNNKWTQVKRFDWMDYANAAWDEGLNCSFYRNEEVTEQVHARIKKAGFTCPVDKSYCPEMIRHYGYLAPRVISQACFY